MMATTWVDFQAVKAAVPMQVVLERYGIFKTLRRSGSELHGRCPIHKGANEESFRVSVKKNCFQCFAGKCGAKGNVLDFVAAMEKSSIRDAALKLQEWFSVPPTASAVQPKAAPAESELAREKRVGQKASTDSVDEEISGANKPLSFTLRGIDHGHGYLTGRGISRETAESFGVGFFAGKGSMSGRCVIPIRSEAGELVAYAGRSIDDSEPRYKLPAGFHKSHEVYNLHRVKGRSVVVLVEGFFDCMRVSQAGYPAVALMGCSMSERQEELLAAAGFAHVVVMLDGDEAGRKATEEITWRLGRNMWVRVACVLDGKQPDQLDGEELAGLLGK